MSDSTPTQPIQPTQVYDAERAPKGVLRHIAPLVGYPALMWRSRYLIQNFFRRELLGRFRGSVLGVLWVLIQPIFLFAIYFTVFGILFGQHKLGEAPSFAFAIYLFSGVVVFNALIEGTTRSCTVVVDNGNLVKKVAFPAEVLPVHLALVAQVVFLVGAMVCLAAGLITGELHPGPLLLALPLVMLVQFMMTIGIGLLLANLHVFARDTSHLYGILAMAWMFLSPVFWFPHFLANKLGELSALAFNLNPAYPLLQAHRLALGAVDTVVNKEIVAFGDFWTHLGVATLWALFFLTLGYGVFTSRKHKYADLV